MIEDEESNNHYNCPIVAMYPEVIAGNMDDELEAAGVKLLHPFLPYYDDKRLTERLAEEMASLGIRASEVREAVRAGREEDAAFKADIRKRADEIIDYIEKNGKNAIILAGRPYHLDPETQLGHNNYFCHNISPLKHFFDSVKN